MSSGTLIRVQMMLAYEKCGVSKRRIDWVENHKIDTSSAAFSFMRT
jgi:hypothetical protein